MWHTVPSSRPEVCRTIYEMDTSPFSPYLTGGLVTLLVGAIYKLARLALGGRRLWAEGSHEEARTERERADTDGKRFENERGIGDWALLKVREAHDETERLAEKCRRLQAKCERQSDKISRLERIRDNQRDEIERLKGKA
jgi:hypothetical protein